MVSVVLSTSVKKFDVSRMRDFLHQQCWNVSTLSHLWVVAACVYCGSPVVVCTVSSVVVAVCVYFGSPLVVFTVCSVIVSVCV